jgi:hypothetical protein
LPTAKQEKQKEPGKEGVQDAEGSFIDMAEGKEEAGNHHAFENAYPAFLKPGKKIEPEITFLQITGAEGGDQHDQKGRRILGRPYGGRRGNKPGPRQGNQAANNQQSRKGTKDGPQIPDPGTERGQAPGEGEQIPNKGYGGEVVGKNTGKFLIQGEGTVCRNTGGGCGAPPGKKENQVNDEGFNKADDGTLLLTVSFDCDIVLG